MQSLEKFEIRAESSSIRHPNHASFSIAKSKGIINCMLVTPAISDDAKTNSSWRWNKKLASFRCTRNDDDLTFEGWAKNEPRSRFP